MTRACLLAKETRIVALCCKFFPIVGQDRRAEVWTEMELRAGTEVLDYEN